MISLEKPGSPEELVHFGTKGMKWGVRKQRSSSGQPGQGLSKKKKVAIGVGAVALAAGTAYVGYKLHQSGKLPVSPLSNRHPMDVKRLLDKNAHVKLSSREWKRYSKMDAADREWITRINSARIQAGRNIAREAKL